MRKQPTFEDEVTDILHRSQWLDEHNAPFNWLILTMAELQRLHRDHDKLTKEVAALKQQLAAVGKVG